jgi:hypothetical protein
MPDKTKTPKPLVCPYCDQPFDDPSVFQAHILLAHPAVEPGHRKRVRRTRRALARIHRRMELMGLDEVLCHQIVQALAEELRKAGLS